MEKTGDGQLRFQSPGGVSVVSYGGLSARDARGRTLPSWFETGKGEFLILVDAREAQYPITVDPLATSPARTAGSNQAGARFSDSLSTAGDVNGDGYSDVIVGAHYYANGQAGLGTTVEFRWRTSTDPDGDAVTYRLNYCTDQTFAGCTPVDVASRKSTVIYRAGMGGNALLLAFGLVFAGCIRSRKGLIVLLIGAIVLTGSLLVSCGSGGGGGAPAPTTEKSYTAAGLLTGSTYYWKVAAHDGNGGVTESTVWSFNTQ